MRWMQANNPDPAQLPQGEVLGITAILLTCSYNTKVWRRHSSPPVILTCR